MGYGVSPKFQRPLAGKLCVRPPKVLDAQERARSPLSPAAGADKNVEFFVCLFVCLSRF